MDMSSKIYKTRGITHRTSVTHFNAWIVKFKKEPVSLSLTTFVNKLGVLAIIQKDRSSFL